MSDGAGGNTDQAAASADEHEELANPSPHTMSNRRDLGRVTRKRNQATEHDGSRAVSDAASDYPVDCVWISLPFWTLPSPATMVAVTDASDDEATVLGAELQAMADAAAGLAPEVPPGLVDDLDALIGLARRALDLGDRDALRTVRSFLKLWRPRLTRLGDASIVSVSDMPLRQIADLVHRLRVELTATLEAEALTDADGDEDERGPDAG
jgi:hypothetical protein